MLVIWDNRAVMHQATGGYDGYDRLLQNNYCWRTAIIKGYDC